MISYQTKKEEDQEDSGLQNVRKLIHTAEFNKRVQSVKPTREKPRVKTINLNINNYQVSFRQLGQLVVQQDHQFKRGRNEYSQDIVERNKEPTLRTIGKELYEMDAQRSLMSNVDKFADRAQIKSTQSEFYHGTSGKPMRLQDLGQLNLNSSPYDSRNAQTQNSSAYMPKKFNATFDSSINDRDEAQFTRNYIKSEYSQMQNKNQEKLTDDQLLKQSYRQYTNENNDTIKDYFLPQVREFEDMAYVNRQRQENEKSKNMNLLNNILREVYYDQTPSLQTGFDSKKDLQRLDEGIVKLDAEKLIPYHPLFRKLSLVTVKEVLLYCMLIRVKIGQTLYREGDLVNDTAYIVLYGKFLLHHSKLGAIGVVSTGDSLGEEGLFEKKGMDVPVYRQEMATAEEESYILEFTQLSMSKVQEQLYKMKLQMDSFTLQNQLKRQWVQKKSWRQFRQQEVSVRDALL